MKLKMIRAKAALSTGKDAEKGGAGLGQAGPQLTADARSPTASAPAPAQAASADYTSFRRAACSEGHSSSDIALWEGTRGVET